MFVVSKRDQENSKFREEKEREARFHCDRRKCEKCGKPTSFNFILHCDDCREQSKFDNATKVPLDDYPGHPVFWDSYGPDDGYFDSIDDLLDYCEENEREIPTYVWGAYLEEFRLPDVDSLLEAVESDWGDQLNRISMEAKRNLREYLRVWAGEQKISGWRVDYGTAVVLRQDEAVEVA